MTVRKLISLLLILAASFGFLFLAVIGSKNASEVEAADTILASVEEAFVEGDLAIKLSNQGGFPIYYTLDGSVPTLSSSLYQEEIRLEAFEEVSAVSLRACAWDENAKKWGEPFTHTYFYAKDIKVIKKRFSTYIVCLTSDPYNLYDYEKGILVEGKIRDEYKNSENYQPDNLTQPANFTQTGREWEREAYVEIFSQDGKRLISQNAGIRVFGYASRQSYHKSFKLYARQEYGQDAFDYPFFSDNIPGDNTAPQASYQRLVVRNNGTDRRGSLLREELFQTLLSQIEGIDSKSVAPVSLWLNGKYYNFEWLQEVYDDQYLIENYGLTSLSDYYEMVTIRANQPELSLDATPQEIRAVKDYEKMMSYRKMDLTEEKTFQEFCDLVDVERMMQYFAIETYIANWDWPGNNVKLYRYYSPGGNYSTGRRDGKWRYLYYDLEAGFNVYNAPEEEWISIQDVLESSSLFRALMQRQDMQEKFVSYLQLCMDEYFTEEKVHLAVESLKRVRDKELAENLAYKKSQDETYSLDMETIEQNIQVIYDFVKKRPEMIRREIKELFKN